jgi:hypothetical protein
LLSPPLLCFARLRLALVILFIPLSPPFSPSSLFTKSLCRKYLLSALTEDTPPFHEIAALFLIFQNSPLFYPKLPPYFPRNTILSLLFPNSRSDRSHHKSNMAPISQPDLWAPWESATILRKQPIFLSHIPSSLLRWSEGCFMILARSQLAPP